MVMSYSVGTWVCVLLKTPITGRWDEQTVLHPHRDHGWARGPALPLPDMAVSFISLPKPCNFS